MKKRPIVLADRDGTLIRHIPYLSKLSDVEFLPGVLSSIRRLNSLKIPVVVVTNQSGVARGYFGEDFVRETHSYMNGILEKEGAHLDGFFYCPHFREASVDRYRVSCGCRKPLPGMLEEALDVFHGDPGSSMMVGDSEGDVLAGKSLGCHNFWILPQEAGKRDDLAFRVSSFEEAVNLFLSDTELLE